MKSIVYGLAIIMMLCGIVQAQEYNLSSGNQTADALIYTGRAIVKQVFIDPDGTNNCEVTLYGNTTATGTVIFPPITCLGNGGGCTTQLNVLAPYGIYADVTIADGGTCTYNIHYREY